jgi:hypothetical protein
MNGRRCFCGSRSMDTLFLKSNEEHYMLRIGKSGSSISDSGIKNSLIAAGGGVNSIIGYRGCGQREDDRCALTFSPSHLLASVLALGLEGTKFPVLQRPQAFPLSYFLFSNSCRPSSVFRAKRSSIVHRFPWSLPMHLLSDLFNGFMNVIFYIFDIFFLQV